MIDIHSHILPGLDDGARDLYQALAASYLAAEDGIRGIVCTPHWVKGKCENTRPEVMHALEKLKQGLDGQAIPLDLYPGTELHVDEGMIPGILRGELLTLNDTGRYALLELPVATVPPFLEELLDRMRAEGIEPIIAHPERNLVFLRRPEQLFDLIEAGALAQLTAASLVGHFGERIRLFSVLMLEHGLAHVLATDCHGPQMRSPNLSEARKVAEAVVGVEQARILVSDNPRMIVAGEPVHRFDLLPVKSRKSIWRKLFSSVRG